MIPTYSILCGLTAFVFIGLLCQPYEVFEWWPKLVRKIVLWDIEWQYTEVLSYDDMEWWEVLLIKPLAECPKCFAGWFSIACYLYTFDFDIFHFIFFVSGSVFTAWVLTAIKEKYKLEV